MKGGVEGTHLVQGHERKLRVDVPAVDELIEGFYQRRTEPARARHTSKESERGTRSARGQEGSRKGGDGRRATVDLVEGRLGRSLGRCSRSRHGRSERAAQPVRASRRYKSGILCGSSHGTDGVERSMRASRRVFWVHQARQSRP